MPEEAEGAIHEIEVGAEARGERLDVFLTRHLAPASRARVQFLIEHGAVKVDGGTAKPSCKLRGGEIVAVWGDPKPPPARAVPEDIPLTVVYEDEDLLVVDKPAGMMVHAGAGSTEEARNRGTLVNALLARSGTLSSAGGELRPGIVHRLDKQTSGLIVVAKNDLSHTRLAEMFARRQVRKIYIALVHGTVRGEMREDEGTVSAPISRDRTRRVRMTARAKTGRAAVSHWKVLRRVEGLFGRFTLLSVQIETGRTHQIRVHMAAVGHPVVGDTLYGAAKALTPLRRDGTPLSLGRNFLHAAEIEFPHPRTGQPVRLSSELPKELKQFLEQVTGGSGGLGA